MKQLIKYIRILWSYIYGLMMTVWLRIVPLRRIEPRSGQTRLTVSVTSYGRRVNSKLRYPLMSMLRQTRMPDRVVVWLDNDHFSKDTIPAYLSKMSDRYGITVMFCDDLKSYKKLIPSISEFPDDVIVTIDDDVVYKRSFLSDLWKRHTEHPADIVCTRAHALTFEGESLKPYNLWNLNMRTSQETLLLPLGCGGILYTPHSLHKDVTDRSLFMSLAPNADDVWFWFMGLMNHCRVHLTDTNSYMPIDILYQLMHKDASLMQQNLKENKNDIQIKAVLAHYGVDADRKSIEQFIQPV